MNFLQDDKGNSSSMRLMSLIALFAAIVFAWVVLTSPLSKEGAPIVYAFLLAAFAPKAVQKYIEGLPK